MSGFHAFAARSAALGVFAAAASVSAPAFAADCDRDCLAGLITQYQDALAAQDPSALPLAADVRFTQNSQEMQLGEGAWETVTAKGEFRQDYLDTHAQVAASHFTMKEGADDQLLYSLVLHLEDGQIGGVETLVQRITPESRFQPTELGKPVPHMNDPVPEDERLSRAEMIETAVSYTEGLRIGSFVDVTAPFVEGTNRIENGVITAGVGCGRDDCDMQTQNIMEHPDITASVAAVDEENSVVLLWMNFGDTGSYGPGNALVTFEAFKVYGDGIHAVNAFFPTIPVETRREWEGTDPLPADMMHMAGK